MVTNGQFAMQRETRNPLRCHVLRALVMSAPLLLAACGSGGSSSSPAPVIVGTPTPTPPPTSDAFKNIMIDAHNDARRAVGEANLQYDDDLALDALDYAEEMADSRNFAHSPKSTRPNQGENLWMGTRDVFSLKEMQDYWIDEKRYFRPGTFPDVSTTGDWTDVGHYTAIIWPSTTTFGCGIASNADFEYLVCRYSPPGNVNGQQVGM